MRPTRLTSNDILFEDKDIENGDVGPAAVKEEDFELGPFIREGHFEKRTEAGSSAKKVGVVFKNLTVKGVGSTANYVQTLPNAVLGTFGPDLYRIICSFVPALRFGKQGQMRTLTNDFTGIVRDGEMMLVLGRPGSGCTTFLKAIANQRGDYAGTYLRVYIYRLCAALLGWKTSLANYLAQGHWSQSSTFALEQIC